jgi:NAD(P)-dependent dehydrogenase (short-subunit alcohol dehydrogenase family)
MLIEGRIAVVTGASQGIGQSIAQALATEGAAVVLAARSRTRLEEVAAGIVESGGVATVVPTDVTDPRAIERLVAATLDAHGRVDVLVNNSGIGGPTSVAWETSIEDWQQTLDVNLTGPWLCCRALIPHMIEQGGGSIINIGSITGKRPLLGRTPYAATKAGLVGVTRTLAEETGRHNIRVNLISPGAVEGPRIDWVFEEQAKARGLTTEEVRSGFERLAPMRKLVTGDDIAKACVFLASDLSANITGIDLNVSAGMVMY